MARTFSFHIMLDDFFKWLSESVIIKCKHPPKHSFAFHLFRVFGLFSNPPVDLVLLKRLATNLTQLLSLSFFRKQ